jgi:NAD(P)-dependent dehydrogenase (short-subunit alcohol dehydrogenase family)
MDYAKYNIRVNNLSPGYIKTNMTKLSFQNKNKKKKLINRTIIGRLGDPKDLVGTAIFLASSASNYITAQDIRVDDGFTAKGDI